MDRLAARCRFVSSGEVVHHQRRARLDDEAGARGRPMRTRRWWTVAGGEQRRIGDSSADGLRRGRTTPPDVLCGSRKRMHRHVLGLAHSDSSSRLMLPKAPRRSDKVDVEPVGTSERVASGEEPDKVDLFFQLFRRARRLAPAEEAIGGRSSSMPRRFGLWPMNVTSDIYHEFPRIAGRSAEVAGPMA